MELNPNHEVTQTVHDQWCKIAAIIMHKLNIKEIVITNEDIKALPPDIAICINSKKESMKIFLTDLKTANMLARKEGGMPA